MEAVDCLGGVFILLSFLRSDKLIRQHVIGLGRRLCAMFRRPAAAQDGHRPEDLE